MLNWSYICVIARAMSVSYDIFDQGTSPMIFISTSWYPLRSSCSRIRFTISRPFILGMYRMLCFDVILFGRIAPAPPAYMLPPQMPSMLNDVP